MGDRWTVLASKNCPSRPTYGLSRPIRRTRSKFALVTSAPPTGALRASESVAVCCPAQVQRRSMLQRGRPEGGDEVDDTTPWELAGTVVADVEARVVGGGPLQGSRTHRRPSWAILTNFGTSLADFGGRRMTITQNGIPGVCKQFCETSTQNSIPGVC